MNSGIGALGPYNHANATIGRAYNLALDQPAGRLGAGRHLHGHARQLVQLRRDVRRKPRSAARGRRSMSSRASSRPTAPSSIFFGGWYTHVGLRAARDLEGEDSSTACTAARSLPAAADRDGPDRARGFRRSRLRHQGKADRLVRGEREAAGARILGRPVGPDADASARGRRRRAVRVASSRPIPTNWCAHSSRTTSTSSSPAARPRAHWKMFGGSYRPNMTVSIDAWR